jgi:hypothetical protein
MGAVLLHADTEKDRRTDRKKLIVTLLNYTKAAKKEKLRGRQTIFASLN